MSKDIKKYVVIFVPKYMVFNILQNNIEDVVKKSKKMQNITYGLATAKDNEQEHIEVEDDEENKNEEGTIEGCTDMNFDDQEIAKEEQQLEQSVQDT